MPHWTKLLTIWSEQEAILIKGLLEGDGIVCQIRSNSVPQFPVRVDGLAEISLFVLREEYQRAKQIVGKLREEKL